MHILFLSDNFPPEVNAPASRTFEHCRDWVISGHRVTVITCAPNFPKGKIYEGYKNSVIQEEEMHGIHVIRVWSYITANEGFVKRTLDYMSYMISAVFASPFVRNTDIVIGTSPQFFTACGAYMVSRIKRVPFVFELRDIWPESIRAVGAMNNSIMLDVLEKLELFLYHKAAKIISVTESFKDNLIHRGIDPEKIEVVMNGVDSSQFKPMAKDCELEKKYSLEGKFVAGYIGTHGLAHALETILDAADRIGKEPGGDNIRFILLGDGANKAFLKVKAVEMNLKNLIFIDSVPKNEVSRFWSLLDVSIIHLKRTELFKSVIPSKLFECMGMGIPILHGVEGESLKIVEREGVGLSFEPESSRELVDKLLFLKKDKILYQQLKRNCLTAAGNYDRKRLSQKMLRILALAILKKHV